MRYDVRRKLVVPALLAACAVGASFSCKDEEGNDTSAESSGEDECYDILDMAACEEEQAFECTWDAQYMECLPDCPAYTDQSACEGDIACFWTGSSCEGGAI